MPDRKVKAMSGMYSPIAATDPAKKPPVEDELLPVKWTVK